MEIKTETVLKKKAELPREEAEKGLRQHLAQLCETEIPAEAEVRVFARGGRVQRVEFEWIAEG